MNANSKVKHVELPSGVKGVVEVFGDPDETVRYTFWGITTFDRITPEDRKHLVRVLQEMASGS